ncbi:MAG: glycine/betaine ABC transporter permease, partial [Paracoccaceae bacterium]
MPFKFTRSDVHWLGVIGVTLICIAFQGEWAWMAKYPKDMILPMSDWLNVIMDWIVKYFGWFFLGVSGALEWPIKAVRFLLNGLPWSVTTFSFCVVAWAASGRRLAMFTLGSMLYMLVIGYWTESMNTLS